MVREFFTATKIGMVSASVILGMTGAAAAEIAFIDLTHPIPTFRPLADDPMKPDLSEPVGESAPIAGFYQQAILYPVDVWPTNEGHFESTAVLLQEHNGTSYNSPNHYINNSDSQDEGSVPTLERRSSEALTLGDLTGKVVFIDVSDRVERELARNNGVPSPDIAVTDFSDTSRATVRSADIEAVADQLEDGVWVVANLGWAQFYGMGGADWNEPGYVNGLNHPGFTREAINKLIEIMDAKDIKISGIAADSLSGDSGQGAKGTDDKWSNAWPGHVQLFQRDVLIVESLANVDQLAAAQARGECSLIVGALNHIGGTGGPARVVAACDVE